MRGSPLGRIALALLGIGLAAIPLLRLTGAREHVLSYPPGATTAQLEETPVTLRLRFSPGPRSVRVSMDGRELLSLAEPNVWSWSEETNLPIPPEGIELEVEAEWPESIDQAALTLDVEPDGLETLSQTAWTSEPALLEFFTFQWK